MDWLQNTRRHQLPRGLTLLTHFLPNSEAIALHFCVKAGYFCEADSEVGLAHLLEHMYFKGSEKFPSPGTIGILMKSLGGMINAGTSYDQTNYFCEVPADNWKPALDIMADAFAAPIFPVDELKRECEVVIEEFNRKLDSPASYSQEKLIQLAFTAHRMKRWRIGTPEQLRSYTRENLFDYFHRYYQPQNMVITVTGKFQEEAIRERIQELFASMQNREFKKDLGPVEPAQQDLRYAMHQAAATQSYLHLGFHVPGVMHSESPALEFLAFLLSTGKSARLHRYVVEQKRSSSSIVGSYAAYEDVGLMLISAVTQAAQIRNAARDIWAVLKDMTDNGISSDEMQKIKNKLTLHHAMQTEEVLRLAELLSYHEAYGGYEKIREYMEAMQKLEERQVVEIAQKYFTVHNMNVLELVNEDQDVLTADAYKSHLRSGFVAPEAVLSPPLVLQPKGASGIATATGPFIRKGEVTYILHPDPNYPFMAAGIYFAGGRNEEDDAHAGITHLLCRTVLKGTSRFDAEQIAFRFDALGNPPRFNCYRDYSGFTMECLPEYFPDMWDLLLHCVTGSRFPEKEVETEKGKMLSVIRRNLDDNFVRPLQLFFRGFYGRTPYGLPETGFEESVSSFAAKDLFEWKERLFHADRTIVVVIGTFDPQTLLPHLEAGLMQLPSSGPKFQKPSAASLPFSKELAETRPKKQTAFVIGFPAPPAGNPDVPKYEVLHQVLNGMGGRLFLNLRSKKSLAYTVHASTTPFLYSGAFLTYIAGDASKEKQSMEGMWEELEALRNTPISAEELENAGNSLIGYYTLNTQTASARVLDYVNCYLLGRPIPYVPVYRELVRAVTREEVLDVARKTFLAENSTMGIVRGTTEPTDAEKLLNL